MSDTPYEIQVDKTVAQWMKTSMEFRSSGSMSRNIAGVQVDENGCELVIAPPPPPVDPNQHTKFRNKF
ncbi:MAG: hypothetical protein HS131_02030 [Ignavibacteriales bacterium]|nr:hypothetical protein [Ignavibacteriales bacterium]